MKKRVTLILLTMISMASLKAQDGIATTESKTFLRSTTVSIRIQSTSEIIWGLLTNAIDYPRWNSTIISIDGIIKKGNTIKLKAKIDEKRTFKLKVKEYLPFTQMIWADGMMPFFKGTRVYTITDNKDGSCTFTMTETLKGLMFPLAGKHIPDFNPSFTQYAADLKKEAETMAGKNTK